jgi:hypothetical protein
MIPIFFRIAFDEQLECVMAMYLFTTADDLTRNMYALT